MVKKRRDVAPQRAWRESRAWLINSFVAWIIVLVVGGVVSAVFIPTDNTPDNTLIAHAVFGAIGALATLVLIIGITYLVHLQIAPYRQRNEALAKVSELEKIISEQKSKPTPQIIIYEPMVDLFKYRDDKTNTVFDNIYAACIWCANCPEIKSPETSAKDVYAIIDYFDDKAENLLLSIMGTWDEKDLREIEMKSSGIPHNLGLAIKHKDDDFCYAYNYDNQALVDLRHRGRELIGDKFQITVRIKGTNIEGGLFDEIFSSYILFNDGKGKGMRIEKYEL